MSRKTLYVHIGTMKTGSTSLQYFIQDHIDIFSAQGFDRYHGLRGPLNQIDLYLASMRYERDSLSKHKLQLQLDENYTAEVKENVQAFISSSDKDKLIFTTEGLSFLRYSDETERLSDILDAKNNNIKIICYLRDKNAFIESYKTQILKIKGRCFSEDPDSCFYVEKDSWLCDFENLIKVYADSFGKENVTAIDYDDIVRKESSIIPSYLDFIGLDKTLFNSIDDYYMNKT